MASSSIQSWVDGDDGWISDESDFYGDASLRAHLTKLSSQFSPSEYYALNPPSSNLTALADSKIIRDAPATNHTATNPHNPYEGLTYARQLAEPVSDFLTRLPPSKTLLSSIGPWIFVANPHRPENKDPESSADYAAYTTIGRSMLDNLSTKRTQLEKEMKGKAKGSVTRKMTPLRKKVETELLDLAKSMHCTSGKWLLFPRVEDVDSIWGIVARETVLGNLGMAAKVATREDGGDGGGEEGGGGGTGGGARLICVYTTDFSDRADVKRVLERMRKLTLLRGQGGTGEERGIYYKCGKSLSGNSGTLIQEKKRRMWVGGTMSNDDKDNDDDDENDDDDDDDTDDDAD
ncbi:hypothetical protein MMC09_000288 [Bachmanniomyces sp. S44760]|nr:hypothetical protein [Bachmanniomyces sp. S44760]